jgi:hypothetical protein
VTFTVTRKATIAPQCIRGAVVEEVVDPGSAGAGTRQGRLTEVMAATPGRAASNAAPVTQRCRVIRGSALGTSTAELARTAVHWSPAAPRRMTVIAVPALTQSVLPLSAVVTVSARAPSDRLAAQAAAVPGDWDAVTDGVPDAAAEGVPAVTGAAVPLADELDVCCAHPAAVRTVMAAATAVCSVLRMPVSFFTVTDL